MISRACIPLLSGMLELYLDEYIYPVYSDVPGTGRLGVSNRSMVRGLRWWAMSLPADQQWDEPSRQPPPDSAEHMRAKFGLHEGETHA